MRSDREVVQSVLGGDREAFRELVERYEKGVRATIVNVVGNLDTSQDVAQEVFVKAYTNLRRLRQPEAFGTWIYRIARREAVSWQKRPQGREVTMDVEISVADHDGRLQEASEQLLAAVMGLPEHERSVVLLRYFGGYKVREVAQILDRSVGTVTKQLSRAYAHLRRRYEELKL